MKNSIKTLVVIAAFGAMALVTQAQTQPALKVAVVEMAKLYDNHYSTIEQNAKLQSDGQLAEAEVGKLNKERGSLIAEFTALQEQTNNPALTAEAKSKATTEAQKKIEAIQAKERELEGFVQNTRNILDQRRRTFQNVMLEEISKLATEVAKRRGATMLVDKSGPSFFGISNFIYVDPAYDITEEVMKEINKNRPANAPTAPAATPATGTTPAPDAGSSMITVPSLQQKK